MLLEHRFGQPSEVIRWMVERQDVECARLGLRFESLWGRPLHAVDCQNLFCEVDKYARGAFPELRSDRVRIKARFVASSEPIPPFYPPKWGLNERIARDEGDRIVAGARGRIGAEPELNRA